MASNKTTSVTRPGGLSLYANLLDPSSNKEPAPSTISRAPVVFRQPAGDAPSHEQVTVDKQISAASLRFQPTKRPQLSTQKVKSKGAVPKTSAPPAPPAHVPSDPAEAVTRVPSKTTLADWTTEREDDDVNGFYAAEKRQRGGKKKRKKNKEESQIAQNWDDIYDPSRPNTYEDYKHSDEKIMEIREWKDKLYAHRMARRRRSETDSSEENDRPHMTKQFAPPPMSFAPPPRYDDSDKSALDSSDAKMPSQPTGEDAYAQRMRLSDLNERIELPPPVIALDQINTVSEVVAFSSEAVKPVEKSSPDAQTSSSAPSISRAPVRYKLPVPPPEIPASEAELESALQTDQASAEAQSDAAPRSLRPGQQGFAERLMSKYGWSKGSGLGASGSGIVNPLRVQIEKQKKKPDSEGGGFVGPGGKGKIVGGKKKGGSGAETQEGKFGVMSEVIVLRGMMNGMDLDAEMDSGDGGLLQEIGEECGEKYGRVERVYIDRGRSDSIPVFVKFTSQLSALRAVNALEGRVFNGNTIVAKFYDNEKFETGIYA